MRNAELIHHRILFLGGPVKAEVAENLIAGSLLLDAQDRQAPINLYNDSSGERPLLR